MKLKNGKIIKTVLVYVVIFGGFGLIFFNWQKNKKQYFPEINVSEEEIGFEVYRNYREGLYACYRSLTTGYRGLYNDHKYVRGGQYNIYWTYYEPTEGNFNWDRAGALKAELVSARETGLKTFLQIDSYGWDSEGALPKWLDEKIQVIDITGRDDKSEYIFWNRFPAPWDSAYQQKLRIFLTELKNKIRQENAEKYIAGIEMGTGPMAQTSFTWNSIKDELIRQSGSSNIEGFCGKYSDGIKEVIDIYAEIFEDTDIPLVLIGGNCYGTNKFDDFKKYAFSKYGLRIKYKMAGFGGWGSDSSCGRRPDFANICDGSRCKSSYLAGGESCPAGMCSQESGTSYDKWLCKDYADFFDTVILEDSLSSTCLYSDDFGSANQVNHAAIKNFAGRLGSKVSFSNVSVSNSITAGSGGSMSVKWKNEGSTALIWPQRVKNSDGSHRERPESYEMFVVLADRNDLGNTEKMYVQYFPINPGTNTSSFKNNSIEVNNTLDIPGLKSGNYNVYIGLSPRLSQIDKEVGKESFSLALWNGGNWGKNDGVEGNNMYLVKENVMVSGNDNRQKLDLPFEGGNTFPPTPSNTSEPTPKPSDTSSPTPDSNLGSCQEGNKFCYGNLTNCSSQSCRGKTCSKIPQNLLNEACGWPEDQAYEAYKCCDPEINLPSCSEGIKHCYGKQETCSSQSCGDMDCVKIPQSLLSDACGWSEDQAYEAYKCCKIDSSTPSPTPEPPSSPDPPSGNRCLCERKIELENSRIKVYRCSKDELSASSKFAVYYRGDQITSEFSFENENVKLFSLPKIEGISIKCKDCDTNGQCGNWNEY